jgi:ankyrin repeat protein
MPRDKYGRTALMIASEKGHKEVVKLLLEKRCGCECQE